MAQSFRSNERIAYGVEIYPTVVLRQRQTCRKAGTQNREPKVDTTMVVGLPKSESSLATLFV